MRRTGVRLVTHLDDYIDHNDNTDRDSVDSETECPLCLFKEFNEIPCRHTGLAKPLPALPIATTTANRFSFRSRANTSASTSTFATLSSPPSPQRSIATPVATTPAAPPITRTPTIPSKSPRRFRLPPLRRKPSPTTVTLRELRAKHSHQTLLRSMRSDEQLQRVYESQILAYLQSPMAEMGAFAEERDIFELE